MAQLPQTVPECHAVIAQLLERVKLLEERVNLDSNNSSKPPSSNGPGRMSRAQPRASDRKRGAQPGHKGHTRAMLDEGEVDRVVDCRPQAVCECGGQVEVADAPQRHQVFEVPPMRAQVDEYRLYLTPVSIGRGRPVFPTDRRVTFDLNLDSRSHTRPRNCSGQRGSRARCRRRSRLG